MCFHFCFVWLCMVASSKFLLVRLFWISFWFLWNFTISFWWSCFCLYFLIFNVHATTVKRNQIIFASFNGTFRIRNFAFTFANLEEKDCPFFENGFVLSIYGTVRITVVHLNFYRWNSSSKATWLVYYLENKSIPYWILWMFLWKCSFACYE